MSAIAATDPQFVLLGSMILWETLYQLCCIALRNGGLAEKISLDPSTIPILRNQGPSYIVSIVHSVLLGILGIKHLRDFLSLTSSEPMLQYSLPPTSTNLEIYESLKCSNIIFMGYLLFDFYHILQLYPKLGGMDMILHHILFFSCSIINGYYHILYLPFGWLILGEISTTFLSLRWLLIKTGRGHTVPFKIIQLCFAITFLVIRVLIYNMGLYHMITSSVLFKLPVPRPFLGIVLLLIGLGSILNLFWAIKICKMALSVTTTNIGTENGKKINWDKEKSR